MCVQFILALELLFLLRRSLLENWPAPSGIQTLVLWFRFATVYHLSFHHSPSFSKMVVGSWHVQIQFRGWWTDRYCSSSVCCQTPRTTTRLTTTATTTTTTTAAKAAEASHLVCHLHRRDSSTWNDREHKVLCDISRLERFPVLLLSRLTRSTPHCRIHVGCNFLSFILRDSLSFFGCFKTSRWLKQCRAFQPFVKIGVLPSNEPILAIKSFGTRKKKSILNSWILGIVRFQPKSHFTRMLILLPNTRLYFDQLTEVVISPVGLPALNGISYLAYANC